MPNIQASTRERARIAADEPDHIPEAIPNAKKVAAIAGIQLPLFASIPAGMPQAFDSTEAEETLRFINRRLEENATAIEGCQKCDNLADLLALQQKRMAQAALDFFDESVRMGETMHKLAMEKSEESKSLNPTGMRKAERRAEHQEAA